MTAAALKARLSIFRIRLMMPGMLCAAAHETSVTSRCECSCYQRSIKALMWSSDGDTPPETITCPFCGLLCDDLPLEWMGNGQPGKPVTGCPLAEQSLRDAWQEPSCGVALKGKPATLRQAIETCGEFLQKSESPLFAGLATDVNGMRSVLRLADRCGAHLQAVAPRECESGEQNRSTSRITMSIRSAGAASKALADEVSDEELASGMLYPAVNRLRAASRVVARAVMAQAGKECVGQSLTEEEIDQRLTAASWNPAYPKYLPA